MSIYSGSTKVGILIDRNDVTACHDNNFLVMEDGCIEKIASHTGNNYVLGVHETSITQYRALELINSTRQILIANFGNVELINSESALGQAFQECSELVSINFPRLHTISGAYALQYVCIECTNLQNINFQRLSTISGEKCLRYAFSDCEKLSSVEFPALNSNSFGEHTDQFYKMLLRVNNCTVHFPSNLQSVIGTWSDVTGGFGGTNTIVLFDLPATT